jgi:tRNA dimethylallyltransferase
MSLHKKCCIVIAGPTAVGKSDVAAQLAAHFNTSVISADSRQMYRELEIGVARPEPELLQMAPHYFIADRSIQEPLTAASFEKESLALITTLFQTHDIVILTGGTGLYIKAFCEGLDEVASPTDELRESVTRLFETKGITGLQEAIQQCDALYYTKGDMKNPRRIMRALEVWHTTGQSILSFHDDQKKERSFQLLSYCLELPRAELYERINKRVDQMMKAGLEAEARRVYPYRSLQALQTVGYQEMFDYFDGICSKEAAIDNIKKHSRHYAKRQLTWFKKQQGMKFVAPSFPDILEDIEKELKI